MYACMYERDTPAFIHVWMDEWTRTEGKRASTTSELHLRNDPQWVISLRPQWPAIRTHCGSSFPLRVRNGPQCPQGKRASKTSEPSNRITALGPAIGTHCGSSMARNRNPLLAINDPQWEPIAGHHSHCGPSFPLRAIIPIAGHHSYCGSSFPLRVIIRIAGHHSHCGPSFALRAIIRIAGHHSHCESSLGTIAGHHCESSFPLRVRNGPKWEPIDPQWE
jgi:hypothetical protein